MGKVEEVLGDDFVTATCDGCGKPVVFARLTSGKHVPLDPVPPCYRVQLHEDGPVAVLERDRWVSHFSTCSKASDFSGGSKEKAKYAIVAVVGKSYSWRRELRQSRFVFNTLVRGTWAKQVPDSEIDATMASISEITGGACKGAIQHDW